jgi:RHS repeat-associated protein
MSAPESGFFTRPVNELFGQPAGYGFAGAGINTATGNFTDTELDLRMPSELIDWARTYNSRDDTDGVIGRGWTVAFTAHLVVDDAGNVVFHDDAGRVLTFIPDGGGGYHRPLDLDADLVATRDGFALRYSSGVVWTFDSSGRLSARQAEGEQVSVGLDDQQRLVFVAHSAGYRLALTYDADGRLADVAAGDGRRVSYGYASDGTLTSVTAVDGSITRLESTPERLLGRIVNAEGNPVLANTYDGLGRVTHQELLGGSALDLRYDDATGVTTVTVAPGGGSTTYRHDPAGRVTGITDPAGGSSSLRYDDSGRFVEATTPGGTRIALDYDERGNVASRSYGQATTRFAYDDQRRLTSRTDPTGGAYRFEYAGSGQTPVAVTDPAGATTRYTVVDGLVTRQVDAEGATVSFEYDQARNLVAVIDAAGRVSRYEYDGAGRRTRTVTPLEERTTFEYDPAGRLTAFLDPSGARRAYRYSPAGLLTESVDPSGVTTRFGYDPAGRLTAFTDPEGRTTNYSYDATGNPTQVTTPDGATTTAAYDALGRLTGVTDPTGVLTTYTYDPDGRPLTQQDAAGVTRTTYDERGNPAESIDPTGAVMRWTYDLSDRPLSTTDAAGGVWRTSYDAAGRPVAATDPAGVTTRRVFTPAGRLAAVVDPLGRTTRYQYDAAGNLVEIVDPMGGVTRYAYDPANRRILTVSPAGLRTGYRYDGGRIVASIDPRGWITRYEYTADGDKSATIGPSGAVQRFAYDGTRRLVATTDPRGGVSRYAYDAAGNLTSITDAKGAVTTFAYDPAGREVSSTDPLNRTTRRAYDAAGNLVSVTDPDGRVLDMEYDAAGRLTRMTAADGAAVSYTYDAAGRRTSMTDVTGTTRYSYDARGRLLDVTEPDGGVLSARYDAAGQRVALRYPDGTEISYDYDLNGRLIRVRDPQAGEAVYALDPDGRLLTEQLPERWARRYRYRYGLLSHFMELRDNVAVTQTRLRCDADGRIVAQAGGGGHYEFRYDPAGQLVHGARRVAGDTRAAAASPAGQTPADEFDITYDAVGNRTSMRRGGVETDYSYDAADQLVRARTGRDEVRLRYDGSGRLVEQAGGDLRRAVTYDGLGQPVTVTLSQPGADEHIDQVFNGDGLLTAVTLSARQDRAAVAEPAGAPHPQGVSVRYRWSVGDTVPQILSQLVQPVGAGAFGADEDPSARFTYGQGRTFVTTARGSINLARDSYGSAIQTAQTARWVAAPGYDPFGLPTAAPAGTAADSGQHPTPRIPQLPRFGYRGELTRGSMVYLRARFYDSAAGRFASRDPVRQLGGPSQAANPYVYANNDPLDFIDPLGTQPFGLSGLLTLIERLLDLLDPCRHCPADPGNSIESHLKCFQGKACLYTRGFISADALDADLYELNQLWNKHQPERAAQAFTIHELNWRREGVARSLWDIIGGSTAISKNVDWEVGQRGQVPGGFRTDIITSEHNLFEVKRFVGPSTIAQVSAQLAGYIATVFGNYHGMTLTPSDELKNWADGFKVTTSFWNRLTGGSTVYVWGMGNLPGHIYFAKDKRARSDVRAKVDAKDLPLPPLIPIPIPIPEPVPEPVVV